MLSLKERIEEVLRQSGLSKAKLAHMAGVTGPAVSHWLSGETKELKGAVAARIEKGTGFSASWLSTGAGAKLVLPPLEGDMTPQEKIDLEAMRELTDEQLAEFRSAIRATAAKNREIVEALKRRASVPKRDTKK